MPPTPPDGFYPFKWQTRQDPHYSDRRLYICPNCSAWFHYDNHYTRLDSERTRKEDPYDRSEQWELGECKWCKARVWSSGDVRIHGEQPYYEPRPVEIARNPLRYKRFPKADLPVEPYGLVFPHMIKPELIHDRVFVDYPISGFPSPNILDSRVQIHRIIDGVKRQTEWPLSTLVNSMWINYWTAGVFTVPLMSYDRFGYPTVHEQREAGWHIFSLGHWHEREYWISYSYRLDVLPLETQYEWLKYAVSRRGFSASALETFAQQHKLTFNHETRWDLQSSGQMSFF